MTNPFSREPRGDIRPGRRPPPDYASRAVKFRLFLLAASIALVAMIASRVRDPAFWQVLGFEERPIAGRQPLTDAEIARDDVDTQLPARSTDAAELGVIDARPRSAEISTENVVDPSEPPERWGVAMTSSPAELVAATRDAWHYAFGEMSSDEQLLFFQALTRLRSGSRLDPTHDMAWKQLLQNLGSSWRLYAARAAESLGALPEDEQAVWRKRLAELAQRWPEFWNPLLSEWVGEAASPELDPLLLDKLEAHLDLVAIGVIRDDTMSRLAEKGVWFRWFEKLRDTDLESLEKRSVGPTGYLPLFKQSAEYRGKVVTVRGIVHQGYRVSAPENPLGLREYFVFWLRPAGGPNAPIVIYCLEPPDGFPPLKDKLADGAMTTLHEEMEFTGYFFKRWAYQATQDILVAPLLLAKTARWQPQPVATEQGPGWGTLAGIIAVAGAIGIGIAVFALRQVPPGRAGLAGHPEVAFELTEPKSASNVDAASPASPDEAIDASGKPQQAKRP